MSFGWSTVPLNNTAELLLLTSTKYLKVRSLLGGIPIALSVKAIQEMTAVTGVASSTLMTTERSLGVLGGSEKDRVSHSNLAKEGELIVDHEILLLSLTIDRHLSCVLQIPCNQIKLHSLSSTGHSTGVVATVIKCSAINDQVGCHHYEVTVNCNPLWQSHQDGVGSQVFLVEQCTILIPCNIVH